MMRDPHLADILNEEGCLVCHTQGGHMDPHHYPRKRQMGGSQLVTFGLLEVIPLCRRCHSLAEDGETWTNEMIERYAHSYFRYQYVRFRDTPVYLGPEYRIEELRGGDT
jgi:hypothetical protein